MLLRTFLQRRTIRVIGTTHNVTSQIIVFNLNSRLSIDPETRHCFKTVFELRSHKLTARTRQREWFVRSTRRWNKSHKKYFAHSRWSVNCFFPCRTVLKSLDWILSSIRIVMYVVFSRFFNLVSHFQQHYVVRITLSLENIRTPTLERR